MTARLAPLWRPAALLGAVGIGVAVSGTGPAADALHLAVAVAVLLLAGDTLLRALRIPIDTAAAPVLAAAAGTALLTLLAALVALPAPGDLRPPLLLALVAGTAVLAALPGGRTHRFTPAPALDRIAVLAVGALGGLLLGAVTHVGAYLGYDPFTMAAYAQRLATHPVSPLAFPDVPYNHASQIAGGAYYLTAAVPQLGGPSVAGIVRYGGPLLLAAAAALVLLVVRRGFGDRLAGVAAAVLFVSTPFVMTRFVMYIRENVAIVLLLGLLLLLLRPAPRPGGVTVLAALLAGAALQTHLLVGALALVAWLVAAAGDVARRRLPLRTAAAALGLLGVFTLPFAAPILTRFLPGFTHVQLAGLAGTLAPGDPAANIWRRGIRPGDLGVVALAATPVGAWCVLHTRAFRPAAILLAPVLAVAAGVVALAAAGAPLPTVRLVVHLAFATAVLGGLGVAAVTHAAWRGGMRTTTVLLLGALLAATVPPVVHYRKPTPFAPAQIVAARRAVATAATESAVLLSPFNEVTLLLFAGADRVVTDGALIADAVTAPTPEALAAVLERLGLDEHPVLFFASKRFVGDGVTVSADTRAGAARPVTIFTVLRQVAPGLPLGAVPDRPASAPFRVEVRDLGAAWLLRLTARR